MVSFDFQWIISIIALLNARKRMISKDNAYDTIEEYGRSCRKRQMKLSEKTDEVVGKDSIGYRRN